MHGSHKLWITISIFLVVIAFLLGMYFTATSDKVGAVIKKKQEEKLRKTTSQKRNPEELAYEVTAEKEEMLKQNGLAALNSNNAKTEEGNSR
ncbi:MAG: superinfection exclusion B family protein [Endomicrobium sp.]|jgi:Na+-translocating ferredoxin:NAD+ oxidoreductase RnfG subunit|nr:superinfection exclusion B family protein [Endomicrobium sp.]